MASTVDGMSSHESTPEQPVDSADCTSRQLSRDEPSTQGDASSSALPPQPATLRHRHLSAVAAAALMDDAASAPAEVHAQTRTPSSGGNTISTSAAGHASAQNASPSVSREGSSAASATVDAVGVSAASVQATATTGTATGTGTAAATGTSAETGVVGDGGAGTMRDRAVASAMGLGIFTAAVGGTYLLADNDALMPVAIAACVVTVSSLLLRYVLSSVAGQAHHRPRVRHLRHHRHFTGERAEYVRASQRLAMMDRDFTAADYEMLLDLDNHSQRLRRFLEGASEETVARLPTCVYKSPKSKSKQGQGNDGMHADDVVMAGDATGEQDDSCDVGVEDDVATNVDEDDNVEEDSLAGATARKCMICLEDFEDGMSIRTLPCFHRFMAECIDPWLTQQAKCPVCKRGIEEDLTTLPEGVM